MRQSRPLRVLFVCTGNICRSPMAEAVFRHQVEEAGLTAHFLIDSAGTGGWHAGELPHHGTLAVLKQHGIDASDQRARQLRKADFDNFDYIVAMDRENMTDMVAFHREAATRARLLLDYQSEFATRDVPDPYYSGGFDYVYTLVVAGCKALLDQIRQREQI